MRNMIRLYLRERPAIPVGWALVCYVPAALLVVAVAAGAFVTGAPPSSFTRDPAVLLGTHPFVGVLSQIGVLIWMATVSISLFTAALLRARSGSRVEWSFLLGAGLLTLWLLLDDFFMFHDWLFPDILGIRQRYVLAGYVGITALFLARYAWFILRTNYSLLVVALTFLALSVGIDQLPDRWFRWDQLYLIEDAAKLLGIAGWFAYFAHTAVSLVRRNDWTTATSGIRAQPFSTLTKLRALTESHRS